MNKAKQKLLLEVFTFDFGKYQLHLKNIMKKQKKKIMSLRKQ